MVNVRLPTRQIFRAIVSQDARIKVLRAMLEQALINKEREEIYDEIIDEFEALNRNRNKLVHGLWSTHDETGRVFLANPGLDDFHFIAPRQVNLDELERVIRRMEALLVKINRQVFRLPLEAAFRRIPAENRGCRIRN